jgi:hypothetical protein
VHGLVDQRPPVVEDVDVHAFRQGGGQFVELVLHAGDDLASVGAAQAQHQPLDGLPVAILGHRAVAGEAADLDIGDIGDVDRRPARRHRHHGFTQIVQVRDATLDAYQKRLLTVANAARTVVLVVSRQGGAQLLERDTTGAHPRRVGFDFEGADVSAQGIDVGHARHRPQGRADHPVEQRSAFGERQVAPVDGEHEHFAQRGGDRCHAAGRVRRQISPDGGEAFGDLLAGPVDVGALDKVDGDCRQAVLGHRAQHARECRASRLPPAR